jgi:hypothetical protein
MTTSLLFGIDFDDTITAAPEQFARFIADLIASGHRVLCITARRDTEENREIIYEYFDRHQVPEIPVIFANLTSKLRTMEQRGTKVDIWIDDAPHALVHGY